MTENWQHIRRKSIKKKFSSGKGWKSTLGQKSAKKQHKYKMALMIGWIVGVFFCA